MLLSRSGETNRSKDDSLWRDGLLLREGGILHHERVTQRVPGSVTRQKKWGESIGMSLYCGCLKKGKAEWAGLGLAGANNFCRLWDLGTFSTCVVSGPGMIRAGECCLLKHESLIEEVLQSMGFALVIFHMKGKILEELFAISKNWLVLGGTTSSQPVRPQMPGFLEYKNIVLFSLLIWRSKYYSKKEKNK